MGKTIMRMVSCNGITLLHEERGEVVYKNECGSELLRYLENKKRQERIEKTREQIFKTCNRINDILYKMFGYTMVLKRTIKYLPILLAKMATTTLAATGSAVAADSIRQGFQQLIEVATAVCEPILWFYALTACVMMVTGKTKTIGWEKLKNVGYAYLIISLIPTGFAFLRWIGNLIQTAMNIK